MAFFLIAANEEILPIVIFKKKNIHSFVRFSGEFFNQKLS
jgi:hypothetical protein